MGVYVSQPLPHHVCHAQRTIAMFEAVRKALLNERLRQMKEGFNQTVIDGYSGFIFSNRFNGVLAPHNINKAIERITRDYNVRR